MTEQNDPMHVPDWAHGIVWYQIMPERFRNGDPNNAPRAIDQKNAWPHDHTSPLSRHPWGADWYRLEPYEKKNGRDIWFNIPRRRYGGDFQGIIDQLDYIQDLGAGALYLNPVFEAPSHHKYDAACYHHADPNFGPDPDGDRAMIAKENPADPATWAWTSADEQLIELIEEVHHRGMYIILDGVFNHMGLNSWIYQDVLKHQKSSPFSDWLQVESWADNSGSEAGAGAEIDASTGTRTGTGTGIGIGAGIGIGIGAGAGAGARKADVSRKIPQNAFVDGFDVRKWEGFRELPELRQDRRGIVKGPRDYIFEITRRWMDPYNNGETFSGVDGWRLDVASCIKHPFWKMWRKHVRTINPDAYLVGEVIDSIKKTKPYLKGDEFDAVMNYHFQFACSNFFIWKSPEEGLVTDFDRKLREVRDAFPDPVAGVMQNLLGSHDTDRLASRIVNRSLGGGRWWDYFHRAKAENDKYDTRKPDKNERIIQKLMVFVQMTWPGAPMIYYGDEAGMWGANDPCCRKPMVWPDIEHEPEQVLPDQSARIKPEKVTFDRKLFGFYRKLIHLRNNNPALRYGESETLLTDDKRGVFVFLRKHKKRKVLVAVHNGSGDVQVKLDASAVRPGEKPVKARNLGFGLFPKPAEVQCDESEIRLNLAPFSGGIFSIT